MGVAIVIVNHLRTVVTLLQEILPRYTEMPVELITENLLIQPDHATPSKLKTHSSEAVPFAIISNRSFASGGGNSRRYTEADAKTTGIALDDGYRLIETLFGRGVIEAD